MKCSTRIFQYSLTCSFFINTYVYFFNAYILYTIFIARGIKSGHNPKKTAG